MEEDNAFNACSDHVKAEIFDKDGKSRTDVQILKVPPISMQYKNAKYISQTVEK